MSQPDRSKSTSGPSGGRQQSLTELCRDVVVRNIERYPPDAFCILDEDMWDAVVRLRHESTSLQKGTGGLDGTGRMKPAVSEGILSEIEESVPHLASSQVADVLVWKDIVESKFRTGGLSRPKGLTYPWPVLESVTEDAKSTLAELATTSEFDEDAKRAGLTAIDVICELPMDVLLLKSSGIGKSVKKFLKACSASPHLTIFDQPISSKNLRDTPRTRLESVLQGWMAMAAQSGVRMKDASDKGGKTAGAGDEDGAKHLAMARNCSSWRELFVVLRENSEIQASQFGARMRERKQRLDSVRPKVVKVRHASSRQNNILQRQPHSFTAEPVKRKIQQLRVEASVTSTRRRPPPKPNTSSSAKAVGGFSAAVAFATGQKGNKRKAQSTTMVQLSQGKRMKIPDAKRAGQDLKKRLFKSRGPTSRR